MAIQQEMSFKKEMSEENRKFNSNWEERYFFVNNNGEPQCLVRLQVISVPKEFLSKETLQHQTQENAQEIPPKL